MQTKLPNLQILLAVLFSLAAIFAPLWMTWGSFVITALLALGLLLGILTLAIGYRAAVQKRPVEYPFRALSARLVSRLAGEPLPHEPLPHEPRSREPRPREPLPRPAKGARAANLALIGRFNLVLGTLLVLAMLAAALALAF